MNLTSTPDYLAHMKFVKIEVLCGRRSHVNVRRSHGQDVVQCHLNSCHVTFTRMGLSKHLAYVPRYEAFALVSFLTLDRTKYHRAREQDVDSEIDQGTAAAPQSAGTIERYGASPKS